MDLGVDGARAVRPARVLAGTARAGVVLVGGTGDGVAETAPGGVVAGIAPRGPWALASASSRT